MFRPLKEPSKEAEDILTPYTQYDFICCILTFLKGKDLTFPAFKRAWDEHKLSLTHHTLPKYTERHLHVQLLYAAALSLLAPCIYRPGGSIYLPDEYAWKVGVVYLLYALYQTQPGAARQPIRVCPATWQRLQDLRSIFTRSLATSPGADAACVLEMLVEERAFTFTAYDGPPGPFAGTQSNFFYAQYQHRTSITPSIKSYLAMVDTIEEMKESRQAYRDALARVGSRPATGGEDLSAVGDSAADEVEWEQALRPALDKMVWGRALEFRPSADLLREPLAERWDDLGPSRERQMQADSQHAAWRNGGLQEKQQSRADEGAAQSNGVSAPGAENEPSEATAETSSGALGSRPGVRTSRRDRELQRMKKQEQELAKKREKERKERLKAQEAAAAARSQEEGEEEAGDLMQELFDEFDEGQAFLPAPSLPARVRRAQSSEALQEGHQQEEEAEEGESSAKGKTNKRKSYKSNKDTRRLDELEKRLETLGQSSTRPQKRMTEVVNDLMQTMEAATVKLGKARARPQGGGKKPRQPREEVDAAKQLRKSQKMLEWKARGVHKTKGRGRSSKAAQRYFSPQEQPSVLGDGGELFESLEAVLRGDMGGGLAQGGGAATQVPSESDAQLSELEMLLRGEGTLTEEPATQEPAAVRRRQPSTRGQWRQSGRGEGGGRGRGRGHGTNKSTPRNAESQHIGVGGGILEPEHNLDLTSILIGASPLGAAPSSPLTQPSSAPARPLDMEAPESSDAALDLLEALLGGTRMPAQTPQPSLDLVTAVELNLPRSTPEAARSLQIVPAQEAGGGQAPVPAPAKASSSSRSSAKARASRPVKDRPLQAAITPSSSQSSSQSKPAQVVTAAEEKVVATIVTDDADDSLLELEALISGGVPTASAPSSMVHEVEQQAVAKVASTRVEPRASKCAAAPQGGVGGREGEPQSDPEEHKEAKGEPRQREPAQVPATSEEDQDLELLLVLEEEERRAVEDDETGQESMTHGMKEAELPVRDVLPRKSTEVVEEVEEDDDALLLALDAEDRAQMTEIDVASGERQERGAATSLEEEDDDEDDEALLLRLANESSRVSQEAEEDEEEDFL